MRMVVTGHEGQVVRSLLEAGGGPDFEVIPLGRPELDLAGSERAIVSAVRGAKPDVLVSAAAYTQVDRAESEADLAYAINANGARALARAARELQIPLIHLSTDYVFDGTKTTPYVEEDATGPTGIYGASKLAGETAVLEEHENSVILRTAWVYGPFGVNFVKTMLRLARDREEIGVVADQHGNPTNAMDIAGGIVRVAWNVVQSQVADLRGVFHMTGEGQASWAEFAETIFMASAERQGPTARVRHIRTADYPTAAKRPANSRLDSARLERIHGVRLGEWRPSLRGVVTRLLEAVA